MIFVMWSLCWLSLLCRICQRMSDSSIFDKINVVLDNNSGLIVFQTDWETGFLLFSSVLSRLQAWGRNWPGWWVMSFLFWDSNAKICQCWDFRGIFVVGGISPYQACIKHWLCGILMSQYLFHRLLWDLHVFIRRLVILSKMHGFFLYDI